MKKKKYGYKQGQFHPQNKEKYVGTLPITYRSSWELHAFSYLDRNSNILEWGSESVVIKYRDPTKNNTIHRYYIDLNFKIKRPDNSIQSFWVEIKPESQTTPPIRGRKSEKVFLRESIDFARNSAKWKYAKSAADKRGVKFVIWTEKQLMIN